MIAELSADDAGVGNVGGSLTAVRSLIPCGSKKWIWSSFNPGVDISEAKGSPKSERIGINEEKSATSPPSMSVARNDLQKSAFSGTPCVNADSEPEGIGF
jgi:hypothetical protein